MSGNAAEIGKRPTMEDAHFFEDSASQIVPEEYQNNADILPFGFFGIYDGHRGSRAAEYAAEHLHVGILHREEFQQGAIEDALFKGFVDTDVKLLEAAREAGGWNDGCTVVVALLMGRSLYTANVGDAEALLVRLDETEEEVEFQLLTKRHSPTDPEERERIVSEGGMVLGGRVGGALAVARALGDLQFKTPVTDGEVKVGKLVSEEPHVASIELEPVKDQFIVVGCDGVWEAMSHKDSVQFVWEKVKALREENKTIDKEVVDNLAKELVAYSISRGSRDNVSACIIMLDWV